MWTATFDRELTSVLGLQSELSTAIAEQVRLQLAPDVATETARRQTANPEAYDLFLRGRYSWGQIAPAGNRQALEFFERAIAKDPTYALAWAGIAQVLSTAPITGDVEPASVTVQARDAVERAVAYGAHLTEVQYALGYFKYFLDWDWPAAEAAFRSAVALDPNSAIAHMMLGHVMSQMGHHVEAREMMRRARELDPFFSHIFALSAQIAFQARDYTAELELARQAIAINPVTWIGYIQLGQAQGALGDYDAALEAYDKGQLYASDNSKLVSFRANLLATIGRADEARQAIDDLMARANNRYVPPYTIALIYAGLSEPDSAFEWLERAYAARDVHLVFLPVDPRWDGLRSDPRFQSIIERCGFVFPF
jgi:tetratricopeptide (TPR) repeat protein